MVLFFYKLREILDCCHDCSGTYELVPISGAYGEIADELVRIFQDNWWAQDLWTAAQVILGNSGAQEVPFLFMFIERCLSNAKNIEYDINLTDG